MPGVLTAGVYEGVCRVPGSGALGISFLKEYAECQDLGHSALFFYFSLWPDTVQWGRSMKLSSVPYMTLGNYSFRRVSGKNTRQNKLIFHAPPSSFFIACSTKFVMM